MWKMTYDAIPQSSNVEKSAEKVAKAPVADADDLPF